MVNEGVDNESKQQLPQWSEKSDIIDEFSNQELNYTLDLSAAELKKCHRKTATATCRNILKLKYPQCSTSMKFSCIDGAVIDAIISNFLIKLIYM